MFYIERDEGGLLHRVEPTPFDGMTGTLRADSDEAQSWLATHNDEQAQLAGLQASDQDMARVVEDLVDVLIARGVIRFTDLPEVAQRKLHARAQTRARLGGLSTLLDDDEQQLI
ncbi:Tryptophan synthase subunit beta like protein [Stutzerimonas stutzeri]|uniref:tryptophan synthase subunit beta n=1 Tax=Stutzerimonas stutzeri subgroup TaxID=578833 RepID=UPI000C6E0958|nr:MULTISPECIES: tryptophan synthase subunit beta [Stutzerimonas stutzeri subgroup]MCQ2048487.1 tryptophan synthase subunit beta [Stutzerimonas kunmingensis]PKR28532.1 tryptophan synthase subunit beta [Stutzerimonas stutzeri]QQC10040.1 tryptophan synthase subunit beta [Stutzerimonas stutzeri]VEI33965.1 Tryptophan synthase subunit beta like protein [Stutzerimonas stutzeri]